MLMARQWKNGLRPHYHGLRALWYRGRARYCPLCEKSFRKFLPKGSPQRTDALCPGCQSLERHRLLWLFLDREFQLPRKTGSVLHFAAEPGLKSRLQTLPGIRYLPVDLVPARGQAAVDIAHLGLKPGSFDLILCCHVLEHIPDDRRALRELFRVLKPGGTAVVQVPIGGDTTDEDARIIAPEARLRRFGQEDHVRLYGRDFESRIREAGFDVKGADYASKLTAEEIARCRLLADGDNEDRIFIGRKDAL